MSQASTMMVLTLWRKMGCLISLCFTFAVPYIFVPGLRADLHTFIRAWSHYPLWTGGALTPQQLWCMGHLQDLDEAQRLKVHH